MRSFGWFHVVVGSRRRVISLKKCHSVADSLTTYSHWGEYEATTGRPDLFWEPQNVKKNIFRVYFYGKTAVDSWTVVLRVSVCPHCGRSLFALNFAFRKHTHTHTHTFSVCSLLYSPGTTTVFETSTSICGCKRIYTHTEKRISASPCKTHTHATAVLPPGPWRATKPSVLAAAQRAGRCWAFI